MTERSFFAELRRRNVIRVAIAYVAVSWLVLQAGSLIFQALDLPSTALKVLLALLVIGFIPTLVFSWVYEITPEGLKRETEIDRSQSITHLTGRRLDYLVIGVLGAIVALLLVDRFVLLPRQATRSAASQATPAAAAPATDAVPDKHSIAVLPFVNMSSDKEQEFFSDGIAEELLNLLAKIPQLQVTARTSSFSFKGKEIGIREIAKTLGVAHILEGSVRKSGNQVRITAQLINAATDKHLWSQTYDRKLDDVFAIQDEIAGDVVKALEVTLLGAPPKARATDPEAYALFLQATELSRQNTPEGFERSDALFKRVLEIDPKYAPAWQGLGRNAVNKTNFGQLSYENGKVEARKAATEALAIDPDFAPAHAALGAVEVLLADNIAGAVPHYEHALALAPTDTNVLSGAATLLQYLGRVEEAVALRVALLRRDPVNLTLLFNQALAQRALGRFDDSIATSRMLLSLSPNRGAARANLGLTLVLKGDAQQGFAEIEQEKNEIWRMINLPMAYQALGRKSDSDAALAALISKYEKEAAYNIAYVYAFRHDADSAFEWLDKAVAYGDPGVGGIAAEHLFDPIESDSRWLPFLRKIGKAPEQLAQIEFKVNLAALGDARSTAAATTP